MAGGFLKPEQFQKPIAVNEHTTSGDWSTAGNRPVRAPVITVIWRSGLMQSGQLLVSRRFESYLRH